MPIFRSLGVLALAIAAASALAACKGTGSSSSPSSSQAQLRVVQGNPTLQALDYRVDSSGVLILNATPGTIQPYQFVSAAAHTVLFYEAGTNGNVVANLAPNQSSCAVPSLVAGNHYTLVIVAIGGGGTSTQTCVIYNEPIVTATAGQGIVVYHNVAGGKTVVDANGNPTMNLYPVLCTPVGTISTTTPNQPCTNPAIPQPPTAVVNGSASGVTPTALQFTVVYPSAIMGAGVAFSVSNSPTGSATGGPVCQGIPSDPTVYPSIVDPTDASNFVPNGTADSVISIFITDSASATSGTNACPVTMAGSLAQ